MYGDESEDEETLRQQAEEERKKKKLADEAAREKKRKDEETRLRREVKDLSMDQGPLKLHAKIDNSSQQTRIRSCSHKLAAIQAATNSLNKPSIEKELKQENCKERIKMIRKFQGECISAAYPKPPILEEGEEEDEYA
jgi:hypothetical protein